MSELRGKAGRYARVKAQLAELFAKPGNELSRMATAAAVLHAKFPDFFWTGFYLLKSGELIVGPYQGPVACQLLERHKGVCWAAVDSGQTVVVLNVHEFPGHIACDARSQSEIVALVRDGQGQIVGVLDIDSEKLEAFDEVDAEWLEEIVAMVYRS